MSHWRNIAALLLLTYLAYSGMFHAEPVFDDLPRLEQPQPTWGAIARTANLRAALWRSGYALTGPNPEGAHVIGFALHSANVLLVYALLGALGVVFPSNLAGAAVFAVHPLLSQAVVYSTGNASALCALFYFTAILGEVLWIQTGCRRWLGLGAVAGILAVLSKPEGFALPLTALAVYMILAGQRRRAAVALLAFALLASVYLYANPRLLVPDTPLRHTVAFVPVSEALAINVATMPLYFLPRYAVPDSLSIDPDIARGNLAYSLAIWLALLVLPWWTRLPTLVRLGIACIAYSPFLIEIPGLALATFIEEHHAYIPGLGMAILVAWTFPYDKLVLSLIMVSFLIVTVHRVNIWNTRVSVWEDAAEQTHMNPRPHVEFANELIRHGNPGRARVEYRTAMAIDPSDVVAENNLAVLEYNTGHKEESERLLKDLAARAPNYPAAVSNLTSVAH